MHFEISKEQTLQTTSIAQISLWISAKWDLLDHILNHTKYTKSFLLVCKLLELHRRECLPTHYMHSTSAYEVRYIDVFVFSVDTFFLLIFFLFFSVLVFVIAMCVRCYIEFANIPSAGMWFCQLFFYTCVCRSFLYSPDWIVDCRLVFAARLYFFFTGLCVSFLLFFISSNWLTVIQTVFPFCAAFLTNSMSRRIGIQLTLSRSSIFFCQWFNTINNHGLSDSMCNACLFLLDDSNGMEVVYEIYKRNCAVSRTTIVFFSRSILCFVVGWILMWKRLIVAALMVPFVD